MPDQTPGTSFYLLPTFLLATVIALGIGLIQTLRKRAKEEDLPQTPDANEEKNLIAAIARSGDVNAALERAKKLILEHPEYPDLYHQLALLYKAEGNFEEARNSWLKAIRLNREYIEARLGLGLLLLSIRDFSGAEEQFAFVVKRRPTFADAQVGLGKALLALGKGEEASGALQEALKINPDLHEAEQLLAECRNQSRS